MEEIFERTMSLELKKYSNDYRECLKYAVKTLLSDEDLRDTYNLLDITYDEYIEDMGQAYLRYKNQKVSEMWQKSLVK